MLMRNISLLSLFPCSILAEHIGCYEGNGADYNGDQDQTSDGQVSWKWYFIWHLFLGLLKDNNIGYLTFYIIRVRFLLPISINQWSGFKTLVTSAEGFRSDLWWSCPCSIVRSYMLE